MSDAVRASAAEAPAEVTARAAELRAELDRHNRLYGDEPSYEHEPGTDFAAIAEGRIAVTPIHFDLTDQAGVEELAGFDLERLLRPATEAVE